ncbi:sucrase ferredoxin [Leucobacter tardus]|uniref:Sucrase ferredoxin n=1 Tax=Leucobacter tardus TaxID=501483 RepID=A0A939QG00_9MICO|nr:sucrase ferredoxin [Leucobacter tardus]MBO2990528.1 sucrase ferredoxin [Leucobacter tardus]
MSDSAPFFCAAVAERRGDSLAGTAPRGTTWVLVEYRGAWPANGFDGIRIDPDVHDEVFAAARSLRARILLVRRFGRRRAGGLGQWAVLHRTPSGESRQRWGVWQVDSDLRAAAEVLRSIADAGDHGVAPLGDEDRPATVLVCAHGQHDVCCSVRGRPVAEALSTAWPTRVWECTHVGGDRFAPNVVVIPDGVAYGRLTPDTALATLRQHFSGRIAADHLRGYTDLAPVAQAAIAALLHAEGPAGRDDYAVISQDRGERAWRLTLRGPLPERHLHDVEVVAEQAPPRRLTCRGSEPAAALECTAKLVGPARS